MTPIRSQFETEADFLDALRDYFAGQALVGIINACAMDTLENGEKIEEMFARKAYYVADAMLLARGQA